MFRSAFLSLITLLLIHSQESKLLSLSTETRCDLSGQCKKVDIATLEISSSDCQLTISAGVDHYDLDFCKATLRTNYRYMSLNTLATPKVTEKVTCCCPLGCNAAYRCGEAKEQFVAVETVPSSGCFMPGDSTLCHRASWCVAETHTFVSNPQLDSNELFLTYGVLSLNSNLVYKTLSLDLLSTVDLGTQVPDELEVSADTGDTFRSKENIVKNRPTCSGSGLNWFTPMCPKIPIAPIKVKSCHDDDIVVSTKFDTGYPADIALSVYRSDLSALRVRYPKDISVETGSESVYPTSLGLVNLKAITSTKLKITNSTFCNQADNIFISFKEDPYYLAQNGTLFKIDPLGWKVSVNSSMHKSTIRLAGEQLSITEIWANANVKILCAPTDNFYQYSFFSSLKMSGCNFFTTQFLKVDIGPVEVKLLSNSSRGSFSCFGLVQEINCDKADVIEPLPQDDSIPIDVPDINDDPFLVKWLMIGICIIMCFVALCAICSLIESRIRRV